MDFSQRQGIKPAPSALQVRTMSGELRASLWNVLHREVWDREGFMWALMEHGEIVPFARELWFRYFKKPFSDIPTNPNEILGRLEAEFMASSWNEVYDLVEAIFSIRQSTRLQSAINEVLKRELAGYRMITGHFIEVTAPEELASLETALQADQYAPVATHLRRALELLADRNQPDYRNSIKESISAVESLARILSGNNRATLGDALRVLETRGKLHTALRQGFSNLYGYTSDEGGIRHAMLEEPYLTSDDAKFFLVSCSAFVNYLKSQL